MLDTKSHLRSNHFNLLNRYVVEIRKVSDLKTDDKHPRKVTARQAEKAASFVRAATWMPPIVIDREGFVLAGQEWLEAANILNVLKIQVLVVDNLSQAQKRALRIAY